MNQKELYLEDVLNHVKTGEPMKHWQWRWKDSDSQIWDDIICVRMLLSIDKVELRIKPEPFKWTTFAYRTPEGIGACVQINGHYTREESSHRARVPVENILTIYHHEIETE